MGVDRWVLAGFWWDLFLGLKWAGAVALSRDAHLSDDEAIAKMGHPAFGVRKGWRVWVGGGVPSAALRMTKFG